MCGDVNYPSANPRQYWHIYIQGEIRIFIHSFFLYINFCTYVREGFYGGWDGSDFLPISP